VPNISTRIVDQGTCDDFEYCDEYDVIESLDIMNDITNRRAVGTFL